MLGDFCPAVSRIDHRGFIGCWLIVSLTKCVCVCVCVCVGGWGLTLERPTTIAVAPPPPRTKAAIVGQKRNLHSGKCYRAIFSTQTFGSQIPSPAPSSLLMLPGGGGVANDANH